MAGVFLGALLGLFAVGLFALAVAINWIPFDVGDTSFEGILVSTVIIGACLGGYLLGRDIVKRGAAD